MPRFIFNFALVACCVAFLGSNIDAVRNDFQKSPKKTPRPTDHSPDLSYPTIAEAALAYNLTTLVQVVSMTPLRATVTDATTAVTVFAPTNEVSLT